MYRTMCLQDYQWNHRSEALFYLPVSLDLVHVKVFFSVSFHDTFCNVPNSKVRLNLRGQSFDPRNFLTVDDYNMDEHLERS